MEDRQILTMAFKLETDVIDPVMPFVLVACQRCKEKRREGLHLVN